MRVLTCVVYKKCLLIFLCIFSRVFCPNKLPPWNRVKNFEKHALFSAEKKPYFSFFPTWKTHEKHTFLQLKFQTFNFYKTKKSCPKNSWPKIHVPIYTYHTVSHKIKNPIPHFKSPNSTDSIGIGRVCILMGRIVFRMIPLFD